MHKTNPVFSADFHTIPSLFFLICGMILLTSEIIKQLILTYVLGEGSYNWWYFPFQLCSIPMYLTLILPWCRSPRIRNILLTFLSTYSLMSGIIVFADTSGLHYPLKYLTVSSYAWHILLIIIGIAAGFTLICDTGTATISAAAPAKRRFPFKYTYFGSATVLYLSCCVIAEIINLSFDHLGTINMFYINPHYRMQQVVFRQIVPYAGNTGTILIYIAASVAGAFLFLMLWRLLVHIFLHRKKRLS